jgi:hypothetical protein
MSPRRLVLITTLAAGLLGCEVHPTAIKVRPPQGSFTSVREEPVLPKFERKGDTIKLRASAYDKKGQYMGPAKGARWSTTDGTVATVGLDGLVEITGSGTTKIVATGKYDGKALSHGLTVNAVIIAKVEIEPPAEGLVDENGLHMGETVKFVAKVYNDKGEVIPDAKAKWRTSSYAATVGIDGTVEGRAIGEAQLVVEAGNHNARFSLRVLDWKKPARKRRR